MTIQLTQARYINGTLTASGAQVSTLTAAQEADFVAQRIAIYVGSPPNSSGATSEMRWAVPGVSAHNPTGGAAIPLGGSDSILSTFIVRRSSSLTLANNGILTFDSIERNDLGLAYSGGTVDFPSNVTQFRFGYQVKLNGSSTGVSSAGAADPAFRRINPNISMAATPESNALMGINAAVITTPAISAGAQALVFEVDDLNGQVLHYQSAWIDLAMLTTLPSGVTGEDTLFLKIVHNAGASALSIQAGSAMWLETLTPA